MPAVGLQLTVEDKLRGLAKASWEYYGDLYRAAYGTTARTTKLLAQEEKRWDILKEGVKISSWRAGKSQRSLRNMSQGQMEAAVRDEAKGNKKKGRKAEEEDPLEARENQV